MFIPRRLAFEITRRVEKGSSQEWTKKCDRSVRKTARRGVFPQGKPCCKWSAPHCLRVGERAKCFLPLYVCVCTVRACARVPPSGLHLSRPSLFWIDRVRSNLTHCEPVGKLFILSPSCYNACLFLSILPPSSSICVFLSLYHLQQLPRAGY